MLEAVSKLFTRQQIEGVVRHILTTVGGALLGRGVLDSELYLMLIGLVTSLAGVAWSYIAKMNPPPSNGGPSPEAAKAAEAAAKQQ